MFLKGWHSILLFGVRVHLSKSAAEAEDDNWQRLGRLPPEVKVNMAIEMTDLAVSVCAEGIRASHRGISDEEVVEKLRERFVWVKRWQRRVRGV